MSDQHGPARRRRFLEDLRLKGLRAMPDFTRFPGRSRDTATHEDLRAFRLDMSDKGAGFATFSNRPSVPGFVFSVTGRSNEGDAALRQRVYPPLADPRPAVRLPPHPARRFPCQWRAPRQDREHQGALRCGEATP